MFLQLVDDKSVLFICRQNDSIVVLQVEGLDGVTVNSNSTSDGDSCDWFVTFTGTPGNQDQVHTSVATASVCQSCAHLALLDGIDHYYSRGSSRTPCDPDRLLPTAVVLYLSLESTEYSLKGDASFIWLTHGLP